MKIISDNIELLEAIHKELKIARIKNKRETKEVEGAMAGDILTAIDLFNYYKDLKDNIDVVAGLIGGVIATGKYLKSQIKVELQDGTVISYAKYEAMTEDEKRKAFVK